MSTLLLFELMAGRRSLSSGLSVNPAQALRSAELWRLSAITVLGYAAILGFTTWAPTALVGFAGIPIWSASLIASLLLVIDIPFAPIWGAAPDRVGRRRPFVILAFAVYLLGSLMVLLGGKSRSGSSGWLIDVVQAIEDRPGDYLPIEPAKDRHRSLQPERPVGRSRL